MVTYNGTVDDENSATMPDIDGELLTDLNGTGDDFLYGGGGADRLQGYRGSDELFGGDGDDDIYGDTWSVPRVSPLDSGDYLYGGNGNDSLFGGTGDDYFEAGTGTNSIIGGDGADFVSYIEAWQPVTIDLTNGTADAGSYASDTISEIENVGGSDFADTITGGQFNNEVTGFGGDDLLDGGFGDDTAVFTGDRIFYTVSQQVNGSLQIIDSRTQGQVDGTDTLTNFEFVRFNDGTFAVGDLLPDDFRDSVGDVTAALGVLELTDAQNGTLETLGDRDVFAIELEAGVTYRFDLRQSANSTFPLLDPYLFLQGPGGTAIDEDDDDGLDLDSRITFTAVTTGTYYLVAAGFNDDRIGAYTISAIIGATNLNDAIDGTEEGDFIDGLLGNDRIDGLTGNDTLFGNEGNDSISGGEGNDSLSGGDGNDNLTGGIGDDQIDGGAGLDRANFTGTAGATVNLSLTGEQATGYGTDTLLGIENITSGGGNDRLTGSALANSLISGLGNDTLIGDDGNDSLFGGDGNDNLTGGSGNDQIDGIAGNDTLAANDGDDSLFGGDGNDILGAGIDNDLIDGGAGNDRANFIDTVAATVNLSLTGAQVTGYGTDTLIDIENVTSGSGNDRLTGNALSNNFVSDEGNDTLVGNDGNDSLYGGDGNDNLTGGNGNDLIDGGAGIDRANYTGTVEATVNLSVTGAQVTGHGTDTLLGIEHVTSGSGNDRLTGNTLANNLVSAAGNDTLVGNGGNDSLDGGDGNDNLNSGEGNDNLTGGLGDDRIDGGAGIDRANYTGTVGATVNLSLAGAQVTGYGTDTLLGIEHITSGSGNDQLTGNTLANNLVSAAGNDTVSGESGNDSIEGGDGNDSLTGGLGNDRIDGGAGTDRANYTGTTEATVNLSLTGAQVTGYGTDTLIDIEHVTSGSGNDRLTGNALGNSLISGVGNDTLVGNDGNDSLSGGDGNDNLTGGFGDDRIDGGAGIDRANYTGTVGATVNLSLTGAQVTGQGADTLLGIEHITSGSGNDRLTGNTLANNLVSAAGNDTLVGNGGNDSLYGGDGNDNLTGSAGADSFFFNTALRSGNIDRITDFNIVDDTMRLDSAVFQGLSDGVLSSAGFRANNSGLAADASDRIIYETDTGRLFFDADGNGTGASVQFATLDPNLAVTGADFFIF